MHLGCGHSLRESSVRAASGHWGSFGHRLDEAAEQGTGLASRPVRGAVHGERGGAVSLWIGHPGSRVQRDDCQGAGVDRGSVAHPLQRESPLAALRPLRYHADGWRRHRRILHAVSDPERGFRSSQPRLFRGPGDRLRRSLPRLRTGARQHRIAPNP